MAGRLKRAIKAWKSRGAQDNDRPEAGRRVRQQIRSDQRTGKQGPVNTPYKAVRYRSRTVVVCKNELINGSVHYYEQPRPKNRYLPKAASRPKEMEKARRRAQLQRGDSEVQPG